MPITYPPITPTLTGDIRTISRFLNNPAAVDRRLRTIAEKRFIADVLLTGRVEASGGAVEYGISESIYSDRVPEGVAPGGAYPRALAPTGAAALAKITKWGQDLPITDEAIGRQRMQAVERVLNKAVNQTVKQVDSVALSTIGTAVTQTQAAAAAWSNASADPFLDVMLAKAQVTTLDEGYDPDTIVLTDILYARLVANQKVISGLAREAGNGNVVTATGQVLQIANLVLRQTNNLPAGVSAMILDSTQLGSLAHERIPSPEYDGDPAQGVETWTRRDPLGNDQWLTRVRRPVVPIVQEPACAVKLTGV